VIDWEPVILSILRDMQEKETLQRMAIKFHNTLAEIIAAVAKRVGEPRVVLTGGCFQNRYLLERSVQRLEDRGLKPYWHQRIPPNDGCIAPGQVAAVSKMLGGSS
jgi:hydrogenase maturation protein HypF